MGVSSVDYVWFVDDDDWIFPNRIREVIDCMRLFSRESVFVGKTVHFKKFLESNSVSVEFGPT